MRPFGSLPRPTSRFQRPRRSWFRRLGQALRLRASFLLVYGVIAGVAFAALYRMGRDYGYFYSSRERASLWKELPDSADILRIIYADQPRCPEMLILKHLEDPAQVDSAFRSLLQDPNWSASARRAQRLGFDVVLKSMASDWRYSKFEKLLAESEAGRLLTEEQRRVLDQRRRSVVEGILAMVPGSEAQTQALCYRVNGAFTRPWPLERGWRQKVVAEARRTQREIMDLAMLGGGDQLRMLRQVQLQVRVGGLTPEVAGQARQLADVVHERARQTWYHTGPAFDQDLAILAHCQKLLKTLDLSDLTAKLSPQQLQLLDSLRDLERNPD